MGNPGLDRKSRCVYFPGLCPDAPSLLPSVVPLSVHRRFFPGVPCLSRLLDGSLKNLNRILTVQLDLGSFGKYSSDQGHLTLSVQNG